MKLDGTPENDPRNLPEFPYRHVGTAYPPSIADDYGPDCPYCGEVQWPCGNHHHNGVRARLDLPLFKAPAWIPKNPDDDYDSSEWEMELHVIAECPQCERQWRHLW